MPVGQGSLERVAVGAIPLFVVGALVASPGVAFGWGHTGHVGISRIAMEGLPDDLPGFLRLTTAAAFVGELGAEPDESKTTGVVTSEPAARIATARTVHDAERDPAHFIDIDEDGLVQGGAVRLDALPPTRESFGTAQRAATSPGKQTEYTSGYLPYMIMDGFQQVRKDFGMWRALHAGLRTAATPEVRAWFTMQIEYRERITLHDIGTWSHFVGDASQPMHVSVHYNGWGQFPNPRGFTSAPIHAPFEGSFVRNFIDFAAVKAAMPGRRDCGCPIEMRVPQYLHQTLGEVVAAYEAAGFGDGADLYRTARPEEVAIVTQQLARGAAELRDEITDAWRQSEDVTVGYPLVTVRDAESGKVRIVPRTFGAD